MPPKSNCTRINDWHLRKYGYENSEQPVLLFWRKYVKQRTFIGWYKGLTQYDRKIVVIFASDNGWNVMGIVHKLINIS